MSLINDALKKAEQEREQRPDPALLKPAVPPLSPPRRGRGWRYLRGFLISLLIVGTLTTVTTHYLVTQLLKEPGAEPGLMERLMSAIRSPEPIPPTIPSVPVDPIAMARQTIEEAGSIAQAAVDSLPDADAETPGSEAPTKADSIAPVPPLANQVTEAIADEGTTNTTAAPQPPAADAAPADPSAAKRAFADGLSRLEVRGLMQASGRVLIFDAQTGKTRAYSVGDSLEGRPECTLMAIEGKSVLIGGPESVHHTLHF